MAMLAPQTVSTTAVTANSRNLEIFHPYVISYFYSCFRDFAGEIHISDSNVGYCRTVTVTNTVNTYNVIYW
jgi:hypothetical protein